MLQIQTQDHLDRKEILDIKESIPRSENTTKEQVPGGKNACPVSTSKNRENVKVEFLIASIRESQSKKVGRPRALTNIDGTIGNGKWQVTCSYCRKTVKSHLMTSHLAVNHRDKVISNHQEIQLSKPCHECDLRFYGLMDLKKHTTEVHGHSIREWKCKKCGISFPSSKLYRFHFKEEHESDIPRIKCPYCKYTSNRITINNHIYNTHKDMRKLHPEIAARYKCDHCEETFHGKGSKGNHMKVKHTANAVCPECSKVCPSIISLQHHMQGHLGNQFVCELCSKGFKLKDYLQRHVDRVHNGVKIRPGCQFRCSLCTTGNFATIEKLEKHILACHSGLEYLCLQCPKSFANTDLRRIHEQNRHGDKTEKCEACDMMFTTKMTLKHHMKQVHMKVKDKVCTYCGQAFFHSNVFQAHVNRHENNRPWKCEMCGKGFLTQRHKKTHMDRHNLVHKCDQCEEKRGSWTDLQRHMRKMHGGERLTCRYGCGYQSWGAGNRGRHEGDCKLNPLPGAPFSVSTGSASQYILDNYNAKMLGQNL